MDYLLEAAQKCEADGIDFIPISEALFQRDYMRMEVCASYTMEEFKTAKCFPKTPYLFWKMIDGRKVYIEQANK